MEKIYLNDNSQDYNYIKSFTKIVLEKRIKLWDCSFLFIYSKINKWLKYMKKTLKKLALMGLASFIVGCGSSSSGNNKTSENPPIAEPPTTQTFTPSEAFNELSNYFPDSIIDNIQRNIEIDDVTYDVQKSLITPNYNIGFVNGVDNTLIDYRTSTSDIVESPDGYIINLGSSNGFNPTSNLEQIETQASSLKLLLTRPVKIDDMRAHFRGGDEGRLRVDGDYYTELLYTLFEEIYQYDESFSEQKNYAEMKNIGLADGTVDISVIQLQLIRRKDIINTNELELVDVTNDVVGKIEGIVDTSGDIKRIGFPIRHYTIDNPVEDNPLMVIDGANLPRVQGFDGNGLQNGIYKAVISNGDSSIDLGKIDVDSVCPNGASYDKIRSDCL